MHYTNTDDPIDFPKDKANMNERIKDFINKTLDEKFSSTWTKLGYEDIQVFSDNFAKLMLEDITDEILSMSEFYKRYKNYDAEDTCLTLIDTLTAAYKRTN